MENHKQKTELVKSIFADKVRSGEMFTSVDLTKNAIDVPHRDVRTIVHELWNEGFMSQLGYTRSLENMDNGHQAFVYAPIGASTQTYTNRDQTLDPSTSGSDNAQYAYQDEVLSAPVDTYTITMQQGNFFQRTLRKDGAIEIPKSVISKVGGVPGSKMICMKNEINKSLEVKLARESDKQDFKVYATGEARVPKRIAASLFGNYADLGVEVDGDRLVISEIQS